MSFRSAVGIQKEWIDTRTDSGFSNFLFVDTRFQSNAVMRRILSLARKLGYQSLLIDEINEGECALLSEENDALRTRTGDYTESTAVRLSFFKTPPGVAPTNADFLGYAVVKTDTFQVDPKVRAHVFEAILPSARSSADNNFIHSRRPYEVKTSLGTFTVVGVIYAQQNSLTFACAHVAMRTALASMLDAGDVTYAQINGLAGIDQKTRAGGDGLEIHDMEAVLGGLSIEFEKLVHEPDLQLVLPTEFQRHLYGIIESGCPALMGFELQNQPSSPAPRHIIPVIGHTFNEDTWMPDAERAYFGSGGRYYPSENWLSTFVVHDDNFGPYYCIPRSLLRKDSFRLMYGLKSLATSLTATEAEAVAFSYLSALTGRFPPRGEVWYDRFAVFAKVGWLVVRTQLVSREAYVNHLIGLDDWTGQKLEAEVLKTLRNVLPDNFWLVEASAPELFASSRRKFGEILVSATAPRPKPLDTSMLIAARLPATVVIHNRPNLPVCPTALKGHTELFSRTTRATVVAA